MKDMKFSNRVLLGTLAVLAASRKSPNEHSEDRQQHCGISRGGDAKAEHASLHMMISLPAAIVLSVAALK
jgi:hypothetical protein